MLYLVETGTQYHPPPLAKFFHRFPHVNISLHLVNSTFAPDSEVYRESLGILGSIPALWLIITLFLLLIYLCTRCCDRKPRPKHSIVILKWTLTFFTTLCCGTVGVGLYGNDDVHNGMLELLTAGRAIEDLISSVKNQTSTIDSTLKLKVELLLTDLGDVFDEPVTNQTARGVLLGVLDTMTTNTTAALESLKEIARPLEIVTLAPALKQLHQAEAIRWPVTMTILSILLVFCLILLFGVARHLRCALITFSVFGLFAVIFSWLMASIYLTASVALGDLCMSPQAVMEREAPALLHPSIVRYYTSCETDRNTPFIPSVRKATKAVEIVSSSMGSMTRIARQLYKPTQLHPKMDMLSKEVKLASSMISSLVAMLDCGPIHREYMGALHAVCEMALFGLTFMLAASIGAGFFFAVLVWLDSHTWIYIRKKGGLGGGGISDRGGASQYATLNRKFRTLDHPSASRRAEVTNYGMGGRRNEPGNSYTLGSRKSSRFEGPGQYNTLSKKCKTLESSDFY